MISLVESILNKRASQVDISELTSSDNIKQLLWPDANIHQMEDWEFEYTEPTLICSHKFSNNCSLNFNDHTIQKLKELNITNIKFNKTPRHVKINLECKDCGDVEFYDNERIEDLSFNVIKDCKNLKIYSHIVEFNSFFSKCTVQNIDIHCHTLRTSTEYFSSNSKITTDAQNISFSDNMYEKTKKDRIKLFLANGDPIDSKFDKQKVDLIKLLGLDIIELTNKDPKIQICTSSPNQDEFYPIIARKLPKLGYDFSYELANGWYLIV